MMMRMMMMRKMMTEIGVKNLKYDASLVREAIIYFFSAC